MSSPATTTPVEQEWPALPCNSDVLSIADSVSSSRDFEILPHGASEDSFSLASAEDSDGWHNLEVNSDAQSDVSDLGEGWNSYLKKVLAPSRTATVRNPATDIRKTICAKRKANTKKLCVTMNSVVEEEEFGKAMADITSTKREGKFHGLGGHTGRKGCGCSSCYEQLTAPPVLSRNHEATMPSHKFGYLADEIEKDEFGTPMSRLQVPYSITAFELNGGDTYYSLERGNAWAELPSMLAKYAVAAPQQRMLADGSIETSYLLEAVGEFLPSTAVARAQHQLKYHIYQIQRHKPTLWTKLATDAPEGVSAPQLKTVLRCRASKVPQDAVVRCNSNASAWHVASAGGHPLDIDLGATCDVSHFSTQGRHPATRLYPETFVDPVTRRLHVEDEEYNSFNITPARRYQGPWWTVKCEKGDPRVGEKYGQPSSKWLEPQWVSKYELWARGDQQGSPWTCVGVFGGNDDATTEVAHSFVHVRGGLRARYLRVRPLETVGGGALRVGVYGKAVPEKQEKSKALARGKATAGDGSGMVTYTLKVGQVAGIGRENRNTRYARDRNASSLHFSGGFNRSDYLWSRSFAADSISARRQAKQETKEFTRGHEECISMFEEMAQDRTCDLEYECLYAPPPPVSLPVSRRAPLRLPSARPDSHADDEMEKWTPCCREVRWKPVTLLDCVVHLHRQAGEGSFEWVPAERAKSDSDSGSDLPSLW